VVGVGRNLEPELNAAPRDWHVPRFLWVGKEWERKNGRAVVEAFRGVRAQNPTAELHLVGDHPPLSAPGVVTHGMLDPSLQHDQRRLGGLFARATCFVMPSAWEPSASVYAEAAAAGVASIATAAGGSETIVGDGGVMVDPCDPAALLAAMSRLARPEEAEALGQRAVSRAHLFTWRAVAGRLLRALGLEHEEEFLAP
jgi:glycosyltransferase involved in cell wall biosynthesis